MPGTFWVKPEYRYKYFEFKTIIQGIIRTVTGLLEQLKPCTNNQMLVSSKPKSSYPVNKLYP